MNDAAEELKAKEDLERVKGLMAEMVENYKKKIINAPPFSKGAQLEGYRRGLVDMFVLIAKGGGEE